MGVCGAFSLSASVVTMMRADSGAFIDVNEAFERQLGWRRDLVLGREPIELGFWPDLDIRASIWGGLRTSGRVVGLPARLRGADGRIHAGTLHCELVSLDPALGYGDRGVFCLLQDVRAEDAPPADRVDPDTYRSLFATAAEGLYRSLPGGGFIDVNPAMARILGYASPVEMLLAFRGRASDVYAEPAMREDAHARLARVGHFEGLRVRCRRRDGAVIWCSENAHAVTDASGALLFYEGSLEDITAQVEAEQALRQSEALYRVLVDNARDGVFLIQRGRIVFANQALEQIYGVGRGALDGRAYMDLIAPEDLEDQARRRREREDGATDAQHYEVHLLRPDGRRVLVEVRADAVQYQGDIASTGTIRDVTAERARQRALADAERQYRELFEDSPVGLFRSAPDGRLVEANPALARMLGFADVPALRAAIGGMAEVYADPAERHVLVRRAIEEGGFTDHETWIVGEGGRRLRVRTSVRTIDPGDGGEVQFAGSVQDISAAHAMAMALQRSEAMYRTLVEHAQVGVFVMRGGHYVYVNQAMLAMLGYPEEVLLGMPVRQIVAPEALPASEARLRKLEAGEAVAQDYENVYLREDGRRIHVTVSIGPVEIDGERLMTGTVRDITRHREAEQRLRHHASHDPLTGLPNRLVVQERLAQAMQAARERGRYDYAVLFLDLDGFKWVNDSLGHGVGDRLLGGIAARLSEALREDCLVARYGGDEFTLLPTGRCDGPGAIALARRVLALFDAPFDLGGQEVYSSASIGIVLGSAEYATPDAVLRDADIAMYRAKLSGKAGFVVFDEAMHAQARERFELEVDLRQALERGEFRVHYQPIVDLADGRITGCEALVRWAHPRRGLLFPGSFIEIAEDTGLIAALDHWVLEQACRQVAAWRERHPAFAALSVNVNVDQRQLASPSLVEDLGRQIMASGLPAADVRLEVTETVFRAGRGAGLESLAGLKGLGVGLVVDDFGTGWSSLDSFAESPFDALKLDRAFIRDMASNPKHRAIVRTILAFADDLHLAVTAEGIEDAEQRALLRELGCTRGQGFAFSPALAPEAFEALLAAGAPLRIQPPG